jgi:hypothetical protein
MRGKGNLRTLDLGSRKKYHQRATRQRLATKNNTRGMRSATYPSPSYLQVVVQKSQRPDHTKTESNRLWNGMGLEVLE